VRCVCSQLLMLLLVTLAGVKCSRSVVIVSVLGDNSRKKLTIS